MNTKLNTRLVRGGALTLVAGAVAVATAGCAPAQVAQWGADSGGSSGSVAAWASGYQASAVRACESGNNYATNTGNGYYGAYQFDLPSWYANGGGAYAARPDLAPAWAQDTVAHTYWSHAGWGPWACKP